MNLWHEYAVEPECLVNFDRALRILGGFGFDTGRLISQFPKKWAQRVRHQANGFSTIEKHSLTELLARLKGCLVERDCNFDGNCSFVENAVAHLGTHPFRAILANEDTLGRHNVLLAHTDFSAHPLWSDVGRAEPQRQAAALITCLMPLLHRCTKIAIVDPLWDPTGGRHNKWLNPIRELGRLLSDHCEAVEAVEAVEIHCCEHDMSLGTSTFAPFEGNCRAGLNGALPNEVHLTVVRWRKHSGGREFHDRYILTDVGGVEITPGLDEGHAGQCYTLRILNKVDAKRYMQRFEPGSLVYERWQVVAIS